MARVEENWNAAFEAVKAQFEVPDLHPEQRKEIRSFFQGKNVFVNLPTGFGKSLIFQCLLIVADIFIRNLGVPASLLLSRRCDR